MPRTAHRPGEHAAGRFITDNHFFFRVPLDFSPGADGDVTEVADGIRPYRRPDWADRLRARLDTVEKVPPVVSALIQADFVGAYDRVQ